MNNVLQYLIYLLLPGDFSEENTKYCTEQKETFFLYSFPAFPPVGGLAFAIETSPTQNLCRIVCQMKATY